MVHESELTFVGMSFFQRWELADLRAKGFLFGSRLASDPEKSEI